MANDGAIAAYARHRRVGDMAAVATALPKCKKDLGRFIDEGRGVCEGPPTLYKEVRFSLCGGCNCTRNKGHRAFCVNCNAPPPRSVCSAQALVQQREAKNRLFGQTVHVPRSAQAPAAPALVGGARGNGGGDNRRGNRWGRGTGLRLTTTVPTTICTPLLTTRWTFQPSPCLTVHLS